MLGLVIDAFSVYIYRRICAHCQSNSNATFNKPILTQMVALINFHCSNKTNLDENFEQKKNRKKERKKKRMRKRNVKSIYDLHCSHIVVYVLILSND